MDGSGRWAKKKMLNRIRGHEEGAESVREIVRTSRKIGIGWLTLYAFSEENWARPKVEVEALMKLLRRFLKSEFNEMRENGIKFETIGRIHKLPPDIQRIIRETRSGTSANSQMTLTLALSYGGRQELTDAVKKIGEKILTGEITIDGINETMISSFLYLADMPDPDLLIRTSGEQRISNFLLWQMAYTEFYMTPTLWPDFRSEEYLCAIEAYQKRERRFGAIQKP
jgi:undecaprenyl diphosphate synthase